MLLRQLTLSNFGIYRGEHSFNLTPDASSHFNRPFIIFKGKNGVGKSTILEAIRVCLHGPLVLGSRVGRTEYAEFILSRIHRSAAKQAQPDSAFVELIFDHVDAVRKISYCVRRSWRLDAAKATEDLSIWEDGQLRTEMTEDQLNTLLRELLPPGIAALFFFDGERIEQLAEDASSGDFLAETFKGLLGINLVERLQNDLDIFVTRQSSSKESNELQTRLVSLHENLSNLQVTREHLQHEHQEAAAESVKLQRTISSFEQKVAQEGKQFADDMAQLKAEEQRLKTHIEGYKHQMQELFAGLAPFAIAPQMCKLLAKNLHAEQEQQKRMAAQQFLNERLTTLSAAMLSAKFWTDTGTSMDSRARRRVIEKVRTLLLDHSDNAVVAKIIHQVSERERQALLAQIDQCVTDIPQQVRDIAKRLETLETKAQRIEDKIRMAPRAETLEPFLIRLSELNRRKGELQKTERDKLDEIRRLEYEIDVINRELRNTRQQLAEREKSSRQVQLALRTQFVLEDYTNKLAQEKIRQAEDLLVKHFNEVCRKKDFIDSAKIDPTTYEVTICRLGTAFPHERLSAGEKQLLAVATTWALHEVSRLPIPVIIDTPLARLDSDHRRSIMQTYFPRASQQVILLGTDMEFDSESITEMAPNISRVYELDYDTSAGTVTSVQNYISADVATQKPE